MLIPVYSQSQQAHVNYKQSQIPSQGFFLPSNILSAHSDSFTRKGIKFAGPKQDNSKENKELSELTAKLSNLNVDEVDILTKELDKLEIKKQTTSEEFKSLLKNHLEKLKEMETAYQTKIKETKSAFQIKSEKVLNIMNELSEIAKTHPTDVENKLDELLNYMKTKKTA
jgi:hypothetical protein